MSDETTYHEGGGVLITNKRAVINGTTYALANISSVRADKRPQSLAMPILVFVVAFILGWFIGDTAGSVVWAIGFIAAVAVFVTTKPSYVVKITSASGEANALISRSEEQVRQVAKALNEAIANRA